MKARAHASVWSADHGPPVLLRRGSRNPERPGARLYVDIRSVIETTRRRAITALDTAIRLQLNRLPGGKAGRAGFAIDDAALRYLRI
jgi:hypothetical protein